MKRRKKPVIIYPIGTVAKLAKHFGVSDQTVRAALRFHTDSDIANAIRRECLENYNGEVKEV